MVDPVEYERRTGAHSVKAMEDGNARLRTFADKLESKDWTGALLEAYNPTGLSSIRYELAVSMLKRDLRAALALATPVPKEPTNG